MHISVEVPFKRCLEKLRSQWQQTCIKMPKQPFKFVPLNKCSYKADKILEEYLKRRYFLVKIQAAGL